MGCHCLIGRGNLLCTVLLVFLVNIKKKLLTLPEQLVSGIVFLSVT